MLLGIGSRSQESIESQRLALNLLCPMLLSFKQSFCDINATYVLVQSCIFLGYGLEPNDLSRREPHYQIYMTLALGNRVDVMAKTMAFGEKNLD